MKIHHVITASKKDPLSPMQRKILDYLEQHPDEVFPNRDPDLARALDIKPSALGFSLWTLERKGTIKRIKIDKSYFGCERAVRELERQLKLAGRI